MKRDKLRALEGTEADTQLRDIDERLFRIRFQMSMGQTEGLKKLRAMKKDRARLLTIKRERELGIEPKANVIKTDTAKAPAKKGFFRKALSRKSAKPVEAKK